MMDGTGNQVRCCVMELTSHPKSDMSTITVSLSLVNFNCRCVYQGQVRNYERKYSRKDPIESAGVAHSSCQG